MLRSESLPCPRDIVDSEWMSLADISTFPLLLSIPFLVLRHSQQTWNLQTQLHKESKTSSHDSKGSHCSRWFPPTQFARFFIERNDRDRLYRSMGTRRSWNRWWRSLQRIPDLFDQRSFRHQQRSMEGDGSTRTLS